MRKVFFLLIMQLLYLVVVAQNDILEQEKQLGTSLEEKMREKPNPSPSNINPIDFEPDDVCWGMEYNYSEHLPIGLSFYSTSSYFLFGTEFGFNLDKKTYNTKELEYKDPKGYLLFTPGFYLRYLSVNCGLGMLFSKRTKTSISNIGWDSSEITTPIITAETKTSCNFMLKPSIKGYIPLNDDYYITVNVGYNIISKFKELNGLSFGLGFQWVLD